MEEEDSTKATEPRSASGVVGLAKEHPIPMATAAVVVVASLRVALVAKFRPDTMAALLEHTSLTVIGGTVVVLAVVLSTGAVLSIPPYLAIHRRGWNAPWWFPVSYAALLIGGGFLLMIYGSLRSEQDTRALLGAGLMTAGGLTLITTSDDPWGVFLARSFTNEDGSKTFLSYWFALSFVGLGLFVLVLTGSLVGVDQPWHLREVIVYDGKEVNGYVLDNDGTWLTVMTHEGRTIEIITLDESVIRTKYEEPQD